MPSIVDESSPGWAAWIARRSNVSVPAGRVVYDRAPILDSASQRMNTVLYITALLAGLGLAIQVGFNSTMRQFTGNAAFAAVISFCVGLAALTLFLVATRTELPSRASLASAPWWAWLGGLCGAFYVAIATIAGPRLGASTLLALTLVGQICTALALDHFGWLGFPQHPLSFVRVAGAACLVGGVVLISR